MNVLPKCLTAAILVLCCSVVGAQDRHKLEQRKQQLDLEMKQVTEQLDALDARSSSTSVGAATSEPNHYVEAFGIHTVNSAGGVEPSVTLRNPNVKSPIKYARLAIQLYDRVGKIQRSTIGDSSPTRWLSFTGPLRFEDPPDKGRWDPVWYNHSGWCITIVELQVEFISGSRRTFSGKALNAAIKAGLDNSCPVDGPRYRE